MRDFHQPRRSVAVAGEAMAATSHPFSTLAALDVLKAGGNAVDAAIAAMGVLCVGEPQMTGVGGDCFVLYAPKGKLPVALNGSGRAPMKATAEWYEAQGIKAIALTSPHAVTVPGAVDAWIVLHDRYGTKDLAELLQPAIRLAEEGCVVTARVAFDFAFAGEKPKKDPAAAKVFAPNGTTLGLGDKMYNPGLAETFRRIGRYGRKGFYEGPVAEDIVRKLNSLGGLQSVDDFALQHAEWVEPITAPYCGYDVYECPPNGQGLGALMIMRTLAGYDLADPSYSEADRIHLLAEATKAAYRVRDAFVGDPKFVDVPVKRLLSDAHAESVRARIRLDRASEGVLWDEPEHKDTVYFCIVDRDGNAISFINSLFHDFGSGIMAPESGVLLHSRGFMFRTDPRHPNAIAPGKRPLHTIIPGMLVKDGQVVMPFGVMGGNYQATGHAHFLTQMLVHGLDPQAAIEVPRSFATDGVLQLETTIPAAVVEDLVARGHVLGPLPKPHGGGQAVWIDRARGVLLGGSDPRKDGCALGY